MITKEILIDFTNWRNRNYVGQINGQYVKRIDNVYRTFTELEIIDEYLKQQTK